MPLKARSSARRRRKSPDEERPEPAPSTAQVMAPTRMKLRVRRRDNAAGGAAGRGAPLEEEEEQKSRETGSRRKNASRSSAAAAAAATTSSSLSPPTSSASTSARPPMMAAEEASPDSKCPICLDRFNKLAYLDRCKHRFCFPCIQEWSHKKPECPLCKQPFTSIFHRNHAEDDFKEYSLRPTPASSSVASTVAMVAAMASAARSSHQMRLMLRRHRVPETGETTTRRRRRERGGRRAEERAGIWEWYLDSPTLPLPPLPHPPIVTEDSEEGEEQGIRGGAEMAERGVVFEGLTGLGGAVAPIAPNDRASRQLMSRLAARQRLQREGGTVRRLRERETVAFRRGLYRCGIRVRGIGGIHENERQWQRDVTAESFRQNPAHLNRLRPWLRRELTVLYGSHTSLVDIVQRIIIARLARYGLENTPIIEEELRPFLLARTEHFMHELVSFARSPLSLDNYDLRAVYEPPDAAVELDGMSSSSEGSSVIAISEEEEERAGGGGSEERPEREGGAHDDIIQTASVLSLSGWDDETPGPSYSTAEPSSSFSPALPEAANQDGGERLEEEEECLIVGYKKPIAERTPELVQLSSDTEEEEEEKKKKEEELPPPPSATPPLSYLSMIPPSTSGTCREEQDKGQQDGEVAGQHSRARSWSGSSGRSRSSVCTLSPAMPGESERRQETGSWRDRKSAGEALREKRRKRKRERSSDRHRKSGTLFNPNRSIYPAMMRHRSPSPFDSSADSSSLPSPSPPDSSWEYPCAQVSPLTSSVSSPSHSSSSPRPPPPPRTPPTPSLSPSNRSGPHHGEKPGGKRKYKSRHLDNNAKDPTWRPSSSGGGRKEKRKERRRRRERERGRRRERHRRVSGGYGGESSRRSREDRSPSVEIIYEGTITSDGAQPSARKRRRKRHRKAQQSSSPVIITLDSDSSRDDANNKNSGGSISSSPLSSQQTVDFSDLPPLPLVHSAGVSGVLDAEIGELPVDILDRGSDGSDTEPAGRSKATVQSYSDHEVDVENVDDHVEGPVEVTKTPDPDSRRGGGAVGKGSQPMGEHDAAHVMTDLLHKRLPEASTSDTHLLASILSDLDRISAPKCEASLNVEASCSPDSRKRRYRDPCAVSQAHQQQDGWVADFPKQQRSDVRAQNQESTSIDSPPPLEQWKKCRVGEGGRDAPPLLRQASPVRSYNRNTPPPLKHKDAGSPRCSPIFNSDRHSHHASADPVLHSLNPADPPSDSRLASNLPNDSEAIPPISTLKRHLTSMLALSGEPASTSSILTKARALTTDFHPSGHGLPVGASSSFGCETTPTAAHYYSFNSSALHSSRESTMGVSSSHSPVDLNPVTSSSNTDFHSAAGWSKETPAHPHSTSGGCRNKTENSFWPPLVDLHPFSRAAGAPLPGSRVSSGVNSHDTLLPVSVTNSRTRKASSPADSPSSSDLSLIGSAAPSSMPSTMDLHPVDFHSSSVASGGRTDGGTTLAVSREERPPPQLDRRGLVPPTNLHSSFLIDGRLNHTAFSSSSSSSAPSQNSISFRTSHKTPELGTDSNLLHPNHVDPHPKHSLPPNSEPAPPKYSRRGFERHTDNHNHITPESRRNSNSPTDAHPHERSAT